MKNHSFSLMAIAIAMAAIFTACGKSDSGDNSGNTNNTGNQTVAVTGVTLSQNTATLALTDLPLTLVATVAPDNATNKAVSWTSGTPAVATVAGGVVTPVGGGTTTITVTTQDGDKTATCAVTVNDPLTSDTGVTINSVKWATRNVNAPGHFTAALGDPGMFYQWNSAIGWSATGAPVDSNGGTAWNSAWNGNGTMLTWESANNPCPAGWRLPTQDEFTSLVNAGGTWTTTPAEGLVFGSGTTVFFPAAGYRDPGSSGALSGLNFNGDYWAATTPITTGGISLAFNKSGNLGQSAYGRAFGFSIRCVAQ